MNELEMNELEWYQLLRRAVRAKKVYKALASYGKELRFTHRIASDMEYGWGEYFDNVQGRAYQDYISTPRYHASNRMADDMSDKLAAFEAEAAAWQKAIIQANMMMESHVKVDVPDLIWDEEIIKELGWDSYNTDNPTPYSDRHSFYPVSWDIKVYNYTTDGKTWPDGSEIEAGEGKVDPAFDDNWEAYLDEGNGETRYRLFYEACEWALENLCDGYFFEGMGSPNEDLGKVEYKFYTAGRSGGHLVLDSFDEVKMTNIKSVGDMLEHSPAWIDLLWRACKEVSRYVAVRDKEISYYYNSKRIDWESDLKRDLAEVFHITQTAHTGDHIDYDERISLLGLKKCANLEWIAETYEEEMRPSVFNLNVTTDGYTLSVTKEQNDVEDQATRR